MNRLHPISVIAVVVATGTLLSSTSAKADECEVLALSMAKVPGVTLGARNSAGIYDIRHSAFSDASLACPSFPGQPPTFEAMSDAVYPSPTFYERVATLAALITKHPATSIKDGALKCLAKARKDHQDTWEMLYAGVGFQCSVVGGVSLTIFIDAEGTIAR